MAYVSLLADQAGLGQSFPRPANSARVYEYLLGGCDADEPDREAARAVFQSADWIKTAALINRNHVLRTVKWSLDHRVHQFLDLGCGYPQIVNVHDVAEKSGHRCRVVYVDNDPGVLAHAKTQLDQSDDTTVIGADLLAMEQLLTCAAMKAAFDLDEPVAVLAADVLPWCTDDTTLHPAMTVLREWMPAGSTLSITHLTDHEHPSTVPAARAVYADHELRVRPRSCEEIAGLFGDFVQQGPGLVATGLWHPPEPDDHPPEHSAAFAGIARKQPPPQPGTAFPQSEESQ
ncbi:SAM-dependent methyltransferase [Streptomyces niveus]|uniref:SAM-dependent methyltransferase n=1 Tax=Streptomyces niveus TaxID=193462 RepID=UPI003659A472